MADKTKIKVTVYCRVAHEPEAKTVLYCRTANGGAEEMALQIVMLNQYAQEMGYAPSAAYCDWNESGAALDRPGMQKLLADVRAGEVKRIIVKDLSRLARSFFIMDDLFCLFRERGVEVISLTNGGAVDLAWTNNYADAIISLAEKEKKRRPMTAGL